jgi:outer membrane protein assembly factor BamA
MRIIKTLIIILLLESGCFLPVKGQQLSNYKLLLSAEDRQKLEETNLIQLFESNSGNLSYFKLWMNQIYEYGYLLANYELSKNDSAVTLINLNLGEQFTWAELKQGNLPDEMLFKTGYKYSFFDQKIVNFKKISKLFNAVVKYAENNSYPFASMQLKKLNISESRLSAEIDFESGPFITFDSLKITNNKIKAGFLGAYLKIKPGLPYDQRKVDNIYNLIRPLPYLSIREEPILYFANEQCQISLDLKEEKASAFDGIIGFLPNENEEGKLLITGQVYLKLENLFKSGKRLELNWKKVNTQSQKLYLAYDHPALFRMPLDFGFAFELYKQDTTFLTRNLELNLFYNNYKKGRVGLNYKREVSRLLQTETIVNIDKLLYADYNLNYYGLVYRYNSLDHQLFPSKGWQILMNMDVGNKKVIKNANLGDDFYVDIPDKGLQWQGIIRVSKYYTLRPKNILLTRLSGGYMDGDQLFLNDLFRLGGIHSIRGFNEMFFYASQYIIGSLEYRYLFENESQLLVFFDGSYLSHDLNNESYRDYPMGVGAGINISTKAGLLNVIYAIGRSKDQPFNIRYSKIHIGYTGRF